ncbi:ComEC/Rec2 family competence protein [Amycolatopsis sp.]|jgi:competence protein ComEC|uniref:ComEC/Rec2 family competence protein n=1 Tax=Amycolatopsis sp. TaxID=37632 RepID=UPI002E07082B|nr:ComEC/Rec2 family competence protein [Amycolatopsis sp.]
MKTAVFDADPETPLLTRRQDLRLVPAAVTLWFSALFGLLCGWWAAVVCGAVAVFVATVLLVRSRGTPRWFAAAAALFVCGLLAVWPGASRLEQAEHDPLRAHAARGEQAALRAVVVERPRAIRSAGYADQAAGARNVVIAADLEQVEVSGHAVVSTGRIVLIAPFERWSKLLPGQLVTTSGKLAPPRGAEMTVAVVYVRGPPAEVSEAPWWQRASASMREGLRQASAVLSDEAAGLLPGLAVGDTSTLSPRVEHEFTEAGMTHLTAVSGTNLAVLGGAVLLLLRLLRLGPHVCATVAGLTLVGFVVLVGPEPSVLRAGVMGGVGLLALALGRAGSALPALAVAVCVLVLYDPAMAVSFGFALSVLATAGLVLLAPRWADAMVRRRVPSGFAEGLAIPLAAFVVTAPVIAGMAGQLSLISVLANILAAPVVAPATVLSIFATVVATFWPGAAELLIRLAGPEVEWLIAVARHASRVPGAVVPWPSGWWGGILAALLAVVLVVAMRYRKLRVTLAALLVLALLVFVPTQLVSKAWPPSDWAAVVCDVGQGDAMVLATDEPGRAVVVDTGPEPGPVDECLDRLGVDRIPLLVISHLHADHIGGLASVFEGRAVGAVAVGPGRAPEWAWRQVAEETGRQGVPLLELTVGQRLDWPGLGLDVVGPRYVTAREATEQDGTTINNGSIVVRAETRAGRMLLTGDVELAAQADLLAEGADLRAEILKVPHHGSRFSLPAFVNAVTPRVAMVSVGAGNTYGHPNKTTLDVLTGAGALVTRTDSDGDTAVLSDEHGLSVARRGRPRGPPRHAGG